MSSLLIIVVASISKCIYKKLPQYFIFELAPPILLSPILSVL